MRLKIFTVCLPLIFLFSCVKKELVPGSYKSRETHMGNGKVYSWVNFDKEGKPVSLGFTMTDAALSGLPEGTGHSTFEMDLPPEEVSRTPFDHIVIDWNPGGHQPAPVYTLPHFDFHFYMMSSIDRKKIPSYSVDTSGFAQLPPADYIPVDYINPPQTISSDPQMGTHWVYKNSPELLGQKFTETFVYGSYAGKVNFIEPMVTYEYFKNITSWTRNIPWPAKVGISGYYPHTLKVEHVNGEYILTFTDLEFRTAS